MKKFLYLAIMALTVGFFASCSAGGNGSEYYKNGQKSPSIDTEKATINGKKYDNKTEKCWHWTQESTIGSLTSKDDGYLWGTEFDLVAYCEGEMYAFALANNMLDAKATYTYITELGYDKDSCLELNDKY